MRRFQFNTWKNGGLGAIAAASLLFGATPAHAVDVDPATTIGELQGLGGSQRVFQLYPRKLVDPNQAVDFDAVWDGNSNQSNATELNNFRLRSLAIITASNEFSFATVTGRHQTVAFGGQNISGEGASAEHSRLIFTNTITQSVTDLLNLTSFVALEDLYNVITDDLVEDADLNSIDTDALVLLVKENADIGGNSEDASINAVALDNGFDYTNFQFAILLLASDDPTASADNRIAWSEFICLDSNPDRVRPEQVFLSQAGSMVDSLFVVASQQLGDEANGNGGSVPEGMAGPAGLAINSPNDTDLGALSAADFRLRLGTAPSVILEDFLADDPIFDDGGAITATVFDEYVGGAGFFNRVIRIDFSRTLTDDERAAFLARQFRFDTSDIPVPFEGVQANFLFGVGATLADDAVSGFANIQEADGLTFDDVKLLQGSGPDIAGLGREVWVAVDFTELIDPDSLGDPNQFVLCATDKNGDEVIVAVSNLVQLMAPSNTQVLGIDDSNLDGTADNPVIEAATSRLFARFVLTDGDDAINSDATWSPGGSADWRNRDFRSALSIKANDGVTTVSGLFGGQVADDAEADLLDCARPIPVAFVTRATGSDDEFCEFADRLDVIWDESIGSPMPSVHILGYNEVPLSDLTTGLDGNLNIPVIDALAADFADRILTPGPTGASAEGLIETFVPNDTVRLISPAIPVDGTANDGSSEIIPGTGFVDDEPNYFIGLNNNAVTDVGAGLGNTAIGVFDEDTDELLSDPADVEDGAAPALLGATYDPNTCQIVAGFSEPIVAFSPTSNEAESYFFIMDKTPLGRRVEFPSATIGSPSFNQWSFEVCLDNAVNEDPGYVLAMFNPGFPVEDREWDSISSLGNRTDPNVTKTKMVMLMSPGARFDDCGLAFVNDANKVDRIVLFTDRRVTVNDGGSLTELLNRFFLRGGSNDGSSNNGEDQQLGGLVESISISTEPLPTGLFPMTLTLMAGMEFPQDHFFVQYVSENTDESLGGSFLVDFNNNAQVPSTDSSVPEIRVDVVRAPEPPADGNPLTHTIVGRVNLGPETDSLATRIDAFIYRNILGCGSLRFTYKGVTYTGRVDSVVGDGTFSASTVMYFHPQLMGAEGSCDGTMSPMGIVNFKPDLDIMYTTVLVSEQFGPGGINNPNGAQVITTTQDVLLYQHLNDLNSRNIIQPIRLSFRADGNIPGRFTVQGSGISNGTLVFDGGFQQIGRTFVDGPADANGARPYTLHTRGQKDFAGRPIVLVVCPEEKLSGVSPFLANNLLVRRLAFNSDINRVGASAAPTRFDIDRTQIGAFALTSLTPSFYSASKQTATSNWAMFPASRNNNGVDFSTGGNATPNRVTVGGNPINTVANFPSNTPRSGYFVVLNNSTKCPEIPSISTALAIDNRGVYCGSITGLNRIATGYGYAIEYTLPSSLSNYTWFNFGTRPDASGTQLQMVSNSSNGGWNLVSTLGTSTVSANSFPGVIAMTLSSAGIRIGGELVEEEFADLDEIGGDTAVLTFQNVANVILTP